VIEFYGTIPGFSIANYICRFI